MSPEEAKSRAFATELAMLCARFKAEIGGCGCCGSPFGEVDGVTFDHLDVTAGQVTVNPYRMPKITATAPALNTCGKCHLVGVHQYLRGAILTEDRCGGCPEGGSNG